MKGRNLIKPMIAVTTTGTFIEVNPNWDASLNDAGILREIMKEDWFKETFKPGDVFVVDRGFRDIVKELEDQGFRVVIPEFLAPNQKQFSTQQVNRNRMCTKVRWVIEARNRTFKRYKLLGQVLDKNLIPSLSAILQITCTLINMFEPRLFSDGDDHRVSQRILAAQGEVNAIQKLVDEKALTRRQSNFKELEHTEGEFLDVPEMTLLCLRSIGGKYQHDLALSYLHDRIGYKFEVAKETAVTRHDFQSKGIEVASPMLIKTNVKSRHSRNREYFAFILYDQSRSRKESLQGFYCTCKAGARTTDPCAHSMAVIWYLSWGQYDENIKKPSGYLDDYLPRGASAVNPDSAEEEEEETPSRSQH